MASFAPNTSHVDAAFSLRRPFIGPVNGTIHSLQDELECYNLPYGGLGFLSNILTYFTILFVAFGGSPLKLYLAVFCIRFKSFKVSGHWIGLAFPAFSLLLTVPLAIYTMYSCRRTWELVLIAVWRITLNLTVNAIELHCWNKARKLRHKKSEPETVQEGQGSRRDGSESELADVEMQQVRTTPTGRSRSRTTRARDRDRYARRWRSRSEESEPAQIDGRSRTTRAPTRDRNTGRRWRSRSEEPEPEPVQVDPRSQNSNVETQKVTQAPAEDEKNELKIFAEALIALLYTFVYGLGTIIGTVGLISLIVKTFHSSRAVRIVTGVFIAVLGIAVVLGVMVTLLYGLFSKKTTKTNETELRNGPNSHGGDRGNGLADPESKKMGTLAAVFLSMFTGFLTLIVGLELLIAISGDFILSAIGGGNWAGVPGSSHPYMYWIYFAAKRLPMLFV